MPNGFWTDAEWSPRSKNRFIVELYAPYAANINGLHWYAKSVTLPSFEIGKEEIKNNIGAAQRHVFARKMSWKPVTLVLVDPIDLKTPNDAKRSDIGRPGVGSLDHAAAGITAASAAAAAVATATATTKKNIVNSFISALNQIFRGDSRIYKGATNVSKEKMNAGFRSVIIKSLNNYGQIIDQWKLNNIILTGMDMGTLSYTDDAPFELTLTFEYEWADYELDPENESNENKKVFTGENNPCG